MYHTIIVLTQGLFVVFFFFCEGVVLFLGFFLKQNSLILKLYSHIKFRYKICTGPKVMFGFDNEVLQIQGCEKSVNSNSAEL